MSAIQPLPDDFTITLHRAAVAAMLVWIKAAGKDAGAIREALGLTSWDLAQPEHVARLTAKARAMVAGFDCLAPFSVVAGGRS